MHLFIVQFKILKHSKHKLRLTATMRCFSILLLVLEHTLHAHRMTTCANQVHSAQNIYLIIISNQ
jgi:hypothetical protein